MKLVSRLAGAVLVSVAASVISAAPGAAQDVYTVMKSTVPSVAANAKLGRNAAIDLPDGGRIDVVDSKGVQFACTGPYKGAVDTCPAPAECTVMRKMAGKCETESQAKAGGTRTVPGAKKPE
jgi:hypothetical protein